MRRFWGGLLRLVGAKPTADNQLSRRTRERDEAVAALRQSNEQFRLLVEGIEDYAIFMLDPQGYITNWNRGAERIKGYASAEAIGQHFSMFYTREDQRAGRPAEALEVAARVGKFEAEAWRLRKDGSRFWASVVIDPLRNENGELVGFAKVTRDITQRLQQQKALEKTREALAHAQKMQAVGQLTGGVAHDFNNLLTTILGTIDVIERRPGNLAAESLRLLAAAGHAAERGAALTARLLAFSRRQALEPRVIEPNRMIRAMSDLLGRTLGESIAIEVVQSAGPWRTLVDPSQLENALLNLAINARDAMPKGGKLTIETGNTYIDDEYADTHAEVKAGQYVLVAVTDTGSGMSPDVLERAFEPFFTTKPEGHGTGLGLSQVYGLVKQSGGHIKLYSEVGQGTTVKIYLPRSEAEFEAEVSPQRGDVASLARGETVLLVEDDEGVREYAVHALTLLGYRVRQAADGAAALKILESDSGVTVLFTDVGLPGINGRQLAEAAHRHRPTLKVLFTTGYARNAIVHNGLVDAGVDVLIKPFTLDRLARKLRDVIDGS
jgi:PAS domain S-box-containing protein